MPSMPNADSPYLASRLQSTFGVRAPGEPSMAGKPNVTVSDLAFPAPPGLATAPVGRPPVANVPSPGMPGVQTPPASPATQSTQTQQSQARAAGSGNAPTVSPSTPDIGAAAAAPPVAPAPLGVPTVNANGEPGLTLTPEGDQRYRNAVVKVRSNLGPMPKLFRHPDLPELPVQLGSWNYNPFTGSWAR